MFTGIITDIGEVLHVETRGGGRHLRILHSYPPETIIAGASIACGGACLTVVEKGVFGKKDWFAVDVSGETLSRTTITRWDPGTYVNLEQALEVGQRLDGHFVTGHIDGTTRVRSREVAEGGEGAHLIIETPERLRRFVAEKGSVALDGVSLTVNRTTTDTFSIFVIPHTLTATTLLKWKEGEELHMEVDTIARYAVHALGLSG